MASGNFFFQFRRKYKHPDKQTTKCLSLDSNKSNVIPPLGHCLVTTVPGCEPGQPLKAGVRANKHCIYAHVP